MTTLLLFTSTALAEIVGCYLPWLWAVDGIRPTAWDVAGVLVALAGMAIIMLQPSR
ncbi:MAG: hypothetical protein QM569_01935 [Acidovorax sp.]|uniref:hypothetical protein n=1 Tax=Acidovorax sp. TaxID=1872122 RepID=UPI0039E64E0C